MTEDTIVTTEYTHLSTSMLNAIRLEIMQHTECLCIHECKVVEWTCIIPVETLAYSLSACPIIEIASMDRSRAEIVDRTIYKGYLQCSWDANNVDTHGMTRVYTRDVTMADNIRFVYDDIHLTSLKEGESIHVEFIVSPGTATDRGPNCDPTSVVAIRDFDRRWLLTTRVNPPNYKDIVEHRLLDMHILCEPSIHTIEATVTNDSNESKIIYAEDLSFGEGVHIRTHIPMADHCTQVPSTPLCTLHPGEHISIECTVMEPTKNVLIIETTGVYSAKQLLNSAMDRLKKKMFG
jgi:hypothetical protein